MRQFSVDEYAAALRKVGKPRGKQRQFLEEHDKAPGRATTMTNLADKVGYASYRPVNLHYGKLAVKIGSALGLSDPTFHVLVAGAGPSTISNAHWVLVMHPEFAEALKREEWIPAAAG